MRAVAKLVRSDTVRKHIWKFLDDLQGSVLDVFSLLRACKRSTLEPEIVRSCAEHARRLERLRAGISQVEHSLGTPPPRDHALAGQLAELGVRMTDSMHAFADCQGRVVVAAQRVCTLVGAMQSSAEVAAMALMHLQHLGEQAEAEVKLMQDHRASMRRQAEMRQVWTAARGSAAKQPPRRWPRVETRQEVLYNTSDPNLVRRLRRPLLASSAPAAVAARASPKEAPRRAKEEEDRRRAAAKEEETPAGAGADLRHGGPTGVYRRDPFTGTWGTRLDGLDGTAPARRSHRHGRAQ